MSENTPQKHPTILIVVMNITLVCLIIGIIGGYYLLKQHDVEKAVVIPEKEWPERQAPPRVEKIEPPAAVGGSSFDYSEEDLVYSGSAPVYVTIYSHNEDSWSSVVGSKIKYASYREGLLDRVNLLSDYNIEWNWQTDQPVVEAMIEYENDEKFLSETGGKNILLYMSERGASLDPHAHKNNYADIAYLINQLGATASPVIGGTRMEDCGDELLGFLDFISWHDEIDLSPDGYVYGEDFPEAKWKPEILSDPGMGRHFFDEWSSGVWRPGDEDDFYSDFPESDIVYIGEGYPHNVVLIGETHAGGSEISSENGDYIKELVKKIADKELPTGTKDGEKFIYTASVHVRDTSVVSESTSGEDTITLDGLKAFLEEMEPYRERGDIVYADFETVAEIWKTEYDSVPYRVDLSSFSFYDEVKTQAKEYCQK
jgi:hypothetical protein